MTIQTPMSQDDSTTRAWDFLIVVAAAPLPLLVAALQNACATGHGSWMEPAAIGAFRPATHLHEVSLWGVIGVGPTPIEAARSWRIAALRHFDMGIKF